MLQSGWFEFLPHGASHRDLTLLNQPAIYEETENSRRVVKELTGGRADIFAYPRGKFNQAVVDVLREQKWSAAVTTNEGLCPLNVLDWYGLPRNAVDAKTDWPQFKGKVSFAINIYVFLKRCLNF